MLLLFYCPVYCFCYSATATVVEPALVMHWYVYLDDWIQRNVNLFAGKKGTDTHIPIMYLVAYLKTCFKI